MSSSALKTPSPITHKRTHIFTLEDVRRHSKAGDCWLVHDNKIYNVSEFLEDHPGGDDLILNYAGRDVTTVMADPIEHSHSDSAYQLLQEYQVGVVGASETIVNENFVFTDHFHPDDTEISDDFARNQFLDLSRPLLPQMWFANFSKSFYLQQVHQPRHYAGGKSAKLFAQPYLECFTVTPWYIVPLVWVPITLALATRSVLQQQWKGVSTSSAAARTFACFLLGNFVWTILEYGMHRFLFHIDDWLPDKPIFLTLHFLLHGIHHYLPMDRLRLVMPPLLFTLLQYPFTRLAHNLFPAWMANGIIAGAFAFYVGYDMTHYALHHTKLPEYWRRLKSHHMQHHYKEPELGFGVTSKFWDWVFDTDFKPAAQKTKAVDVQ